MAAGLGPARCVAAVNLNAESNMQGCAAALQPPNSEARLVGHLDERGSSTGLLRKAWRGAAFRSRAPLSLPAMSLPPHLARAASHCASSIHVSFARY